MPCSNKLYIQYKRQHNAGLAFLLSPFLLPVASQIHRIANKQGNEENQRKQNLAGIYKHFMSQWMLIYISHGLRPSQLLVLQRLSPFRHLQVTTAIIQLHVVNHTSAILCSYLCLHCHVFLRLVCTDCLQCVTCTVVQTNQVQVQVLVHGLFSAWIPLKVVPHANTHWF